MLSQWSLATTEQFAVFPAPIAKPSPPLTSQAYRGTQAAAIAPPYVVGGGMILTRMTRTPAPLAVQQDRRDITGCRPADQRSNSAALIIPAKSRGTQYGLAIALFSPLTTSMMSSTTSVIQPSPARPVEPLQSSPEDRQKAIAHLSLKLMMSGRDRGSFCPRIESWVEAELRGRAQRTRERLDSLLHWKSAASQLILIPHRS